MKGFIDLVFECNGCFYIIDWKSNYLGARYESYDQPFLIEAMAEHFYFLQYHIYTVALDRYLKTRLPDYDYDKHFGGVFYIFLRGLNSDYDKQYGIYKSRPSIETTATLSQILVASA